MEDQLREAGEIATDFGQTLSWQYLNYVRRHPIHDWQGPDLHPLWRAGCNDAPVHGGSIRHPQPGSAYPRTR